MRKYLDIPLTIVVTLTLTVAMLWPQEAPPPAPEGSDKCMKITFPNSGPYRNPQAPDLGHVSI